MSLFRRRVVTALASAAALVVLGGAVAVPTARAASPIPMFAAALNAGTVTTGIGRLGVVGYGIVSALPAEASDDASGDARVAGIQFQLRETDPATASRAVTGNSIDSALLNAGTATTGMGPAGRVGTGIVGVR